MITDEQLNMLASFTGSLAVMMIVVYHFLEVNAKPEEGEVLLSEERRQDVGAAPAPVR